MARAGIEKSDVQRARSSLLAQGLYPSIDAVRAELGNTGSKSTIHRYLKELEDEAGQPPAQGLAVGEAIQNLVQQLAAALQATADDRVAAANLAHQASTAQWREEIETHRHAADALRLQLLQSQSALADQTSRYDATLATLQAESKENARLAQQVRDLQERLEAESAHRISLEDKHEHARLALEHFRQAAKEQREQEQLRHAEQIQQLQAEMRLARQTLIVKQDDLTRLHQDNSRQTTELLHLTRQLEHAHSSAQQALQQRDALQGTEQRNAELAAALAQCEARESALASRLSSVLGQSSEREDKLRAQELELARSQVRLEEQQRQLEDWRALLGQLRQRSADSSDAIERAQPEGTAAGTGVIEKADPLADTHSPAQTDKPKPPAA